MALAAFCAVFPVSGTAGAAETPVNRLQSPAVFQQTVKALQAIDQGQWDVGRAMIARTKDPLAAKLYYWLLFTRGEEPQPFIRLAQFVHQNPEWPGIADIKTRIEDEMPPHLKPRDVIAWFEAHPPRTARGLDKYLQAMILSGRAETARGILATWWADTAMAHEDQALILSKYKSFLDRSAHSKRLDAMLLRGQHTNAQAIAALLGKEYQALAAARIALAENAPGVNRLIDQVPARLKNDPGLMYERLRWRRRNGHDAGAMQILHNPPPRGAIQNLPAWWHERHILIRRLIERKHYESAYLLASTHMQSAGLSHAQAEWLAGWLALRFLDKVPQALQHFEALYHAVSTPVSKARAAYWAGRALKALGRQEESQTWFQRAARYPAVFYGQMAGAELGLSETLPHAAPPVLTPEHTNHFKARELIQAARLFHTAGTRKEVSRFLQAFLAREETPHAYRFAAELASDMGRYHDAVRIAKQATGKSLFLTAQSYPLITEKMTALPVEWALVHALIRQESLFDVKAQSPAGARGLMQLMPATAREVAAELGVPHRTDWLTLRPAHNLLLGSRYLQNMLVRFNGSYSLAIAAYNAGPNRVENWLEVFGDPRLGEVDLIDWIEMLPIYETRNYVQRVLENIYIYRLRLRGIQKQPGGQIHIATFESER